MSDMKFLQPEYSDIPQLKKMWADVFDESQNAVDLIFDRYFDLFIPFCAKHNSKVVSALYLVSCTLNGCKAHYLLGASTLPKYRNQGIMSQLIEFALNKSAENGDKFSLLLPANKKLYSFYEAFGYKTFCSAKTATISRQKLVEYKSIEQVDGSSNYPDYQKLQTNCFKRNFTLYKNRFFEFAKEYYSIYGAKTAANKNSFAIIEENDGIAYVIYSVYSDFQSFISLLLSNTNSEMFKIKIKADNNAFVNAIQYKSGMIKTLDKQVKMPGDGIYIGITLE